MAGVTCHMSGVKWGGGTVVELVGGGFVINGHMDSKFSQTIFQKLHKGFLT